MKLKLMLWGGHVWLPLRPKRGMSASCKCTDHLGKQQGYHTGAEAPLLSKGSKDIITHSSPRNFRYQAAFLGAPANSWNAPMGIIGIAMKPMAVALGSHHSLMLP